MTGDRRHHYTNSSKLKIVRAIEAAILRADNPLSIRAACTEQRIDPKQYRTWKSNIFGIMSEPRRQKISHPGRTPSISDEAEEALIIWLIERREFGMHVNYDMLARKLGELDNEFRRKTDKAKKLSFVD